MHPTLCSVRALRPDELCASHIGSYTLVYGRTPLTLSSGVNAQMIARYGTPVGIASETRASTQQQHHTGTVPYANPPSPVTAEALRTRVCTATLPMHVIQPAIPISKSAQDLLRAPYMLLTK